MPNPPSKAFLDRVRQHPKFDYANELADLIQKSNTEALSVLNNRFTEAMEEIKGMAKK